MARSSSVGIAGASLGGDFGSMFKSTSYSIDVTAPVWAIDLALPPVGPPNEHQRLPGCGLHGDARGCDHHRPAGYLHLRRQVLAGWRVGAAMVFINEGQGRTDPLWFNFDGIDIPTFAATVETGTELANGVLSGDTGLKARFKVDWRPGTYSTTNVIAETTARSTT